MTRTPPPPSYATAPTPGARHQLPGVARTARLLGVPLMPWQRQVARVATELRPDGRWRYRTIVVTVPRQSGKTTLVQALQVHRAITRPERLAAYYTAQTGKDASAKWAELVERIDSTPLAGLLPKPRLSAGSQALLFPNGSSLHPFAPRPTSLHGKTTPLVIIDEAFAHDAEAGALLEGAVKPAQLTLPDKQLWIISTAGSAESTWLRSWTDQGRASLGDPEANLAYFEWSLADGLNPYDPASWWTFHPALGLTITEESLADDAKGTPPGEWERGYCNRWVEAETPIMDLARFDSLAAEPEWLPRPAEDATLAITYAAANDRSESAVMLSWMAQDQAITTALRVGQGMSWVPEAVNLALTRWPDAVVGAHDEGPTRQLTDWVRRDGIAQPVVVSGHDWPTACSTWLWRANTDQLAHDGSPSLRASVQAAATRPSGAGWVFSEQHSPGPIAALMASAAGVRLAEHAPATALPVVAFG